MSRKRKCFDCRNSMRWALPSKVGSQDIDYAKQCLAMEETTCVCDRTMKTKPRGYEQYCRYFQEKSEADRKMDELMDGTEVPNLRKAIEDYERSREGHGDEDYKAV